MAKGFIENNVLNESRRIVIEIEKQFDPAVEASIIRDALKKSAKEFADKWLEENRDKVVERLNVDALANMILLEAAKQTKDDILSTKDK